MHSTLIPERPLLISPTLAATIGLEEAVMLHVLSELIATRRLSSSGAGSREGRWIDLDESGLQAALPFWTPIDIRRVQASLRELGLLSVEAMPGSSAGKLQRLSINDGEDERKLSEESRASQAVSHTADAASPRQGLPVYSQPPVSPAGSGGSSSAATLIAANWQPESTWIKQCQQHNIPEEFLRENFLSLFNIGAIAGRRGSLGAMLFINTY